MSMKLVGEVHLYVFECSGCGGTVRAQDPPSKCPHCGLSGAQEDPPEYHAHKRESEKRLGDVERGMLAGLEVLIESLDAGEFDQFSVASWLTRDAHRYPDEEPRLKTVHAVRTDTLRATLEESIRRIKAGEIR